MEKWEDRKCFNFPPFVWFRMKKWSDGKSEFV